MNRVPFTYSAIRYARDPFSGECLNVGVVLYAPEVHFLRAQFELSTARLSHAFKEFDRFAYRHAVAGFEDGIETLRTATSEIGLRVGRFSDVGAAVREIWPDRNLSLRVGEVQPGLSASPEKALADLFHTLVVSQASEHARRPRREREDVWKRVEQEFPEVRARFGPHVFKTEGFEIKVDHSIRNGRLHVLEPLSFDYADKGDIFEVVAGWRGRLDLVAKAEKEEPEFVFVVAEPSIPGFRDAARKGIAILEGSATKPRVVKESRLRDFLPNFKRTVLESRH